MYVTWTVWRTCSFIVVGLWSLSWRSYLSAQELPLLSQWGDQVANHYADMWGQVLNTSDGPHYYAYIGHYENDGGTYTEANGTRVNDRKDGVHIIEVTDPARPIEAAFWTAPNASAPKRKEFRAVYVDSRNIAYFCSQEESPFTSGTNRGGVYLVDVSDPSNPRNLSEIDQRNGGHKNVHNAYVATMGSKTYLFTVSVDEPSGTSHSCYVFDVTYPRAPRKLYTLEINPNIYYYAHDKRNEHVHGHDLLWKNGLLYVSFIEPIKGVSIFNTATIATSAPKKILLMSGHTEASLITNSGHDAYPTTDGQYLYNSREKLNGAVQIYRVKDATGKWILNPVFTQTTKTQFGYRSYCTAHHTYVLGNKILAYSAYQAGVRIFDIVKRTAPKQIFYFDTHPESDDPLYPVNELKGCWGLYYFPTYSNPSYPGIKALIVASDIDRGLFVLDATAIANYN
jgi:hypothetical protein